MMTTSYRFKFYFNARHSVTFNGVTSAIHPHTWEVSVLFYSEESQTVNFSEFEKEFENYFLNYEGKYMNDLRDFKNINPTMENISKIMFVDIKSIVNLRGMSIGRIEISENPTRSYIIEE